MIFEAGVLLLKGFAENLDATNWESMQFCSQPSVLHGKQDKPTEALGLARFWTLAHNEEQSWDGVRQLKDEQLAIGTNQKRPDGAHPCLRLQLVPPVSINRQL
jgi:hypothetical protein